MAFTTEKKKYTSTPEYKRLRKRREAKALHLMGYSFVDIARRLELPETTVRRYAGGPA